jgi:hypothetical protein
MQLTFIRLVILVTLPALIIGAAIVVAGYGW